MTDGPDVNPLPLSVAIVCRDNESTIGRTLESVRGLASEIVGVDSGSTDGTIGMLERAGARVIRTEWLGHVRTKQMALDACTQPWVLCLDSDESVESDLAASIRRVVTASNPPDACRFNRRTWYRGTPLRYAWQPELRLRLVQRGRAAWAGLDPHDVLRPVARDARVETLDGTLRHDSFASFAEHLQVQWRHARTMAESLHGAGRRASLLSLFVSPPGAFLKQLVLKRAFLDGYAGWLAAASTAAGTLMKHMILIERQASARSGGGVNRDEGR